MIVSNWDLLRGIRQRRSRRLQSPPPNSGAVPPAGYDYLIKQPFPNSPYLTTTYGVILTVGAGGSWESLWAQQHSVILSGGTYYHYYTGGSSDTALQVGLATSSDGITLTKSGSNPILTPGAGGTWDATAVANPIVWLEGSTWHMLYGGNNSTAWAVGHATSANGTSWTKDAANPVLLETASAWDSKFVFPSSVLKIGGTYWMYYWGSTSTTDATTFKIGLATAVSPSGPWTKHPLNPLLVGAGSAAWDAGVLDPCILIRGGVYYMLYQGNTNTGAHSATGIAWSLDGLNWVRDPNNPRMNFRGGSWFDSAWGGEVPHAVQVGSDWYVYWNGSNGTSPKAQEGYALWLPFGSTLSTLFTTLQAYYELDASAGDATDNGFHCSVNGQTGGTGTGPDGSEQVLVFTAANPTRAVTATSITNLQIGTGDFCISAWAYLATKGSPTTRVIAAKYNPTGGGHEWFLDYNGGTDRYRFAVSTDGSADSARDASTYGSPATTTWTHILAWVDRTGNTINICVNDGTVDTTNLTFTAQALTNAVHIGDFQTEILGWDGRLAKIMIFKSAAGGGAIPTATQRTWLYNSGAGRTYKELPTAP